MTAQAFEALKTYDWGMDRKVLQPIDDAIVASYGDEPARQALETQLVAVLGTDAPLDAKQYVCRHLRVIGSPACVPALAGLLGEKELAHMGRYALERMPCAEAGQALRDALPKAEGELKIGIITSLGMRGDAENTAPLAALLADSDAATARAAALALGAIRSPEASKALAGAKPTADTKIAVTDASLACAESLLKSGKKAEALAVYKSMAGEDQPKHVRLAATRGMLACSAE